MYNLHKTILLYINEMFKFKINNGKPTDWSRILLIIHNQVLLITMNTWYQMWGKTYQCQISNAGGWFIGVRFSKFHDFSMTFDDFSKFHDFPWLFQKILFFQVFQTLWEPCKDAIYSRIPLSRAPLTRENQLVALAPWTPNFSDAPLATARMTDR